MMISQVLLGHCTQMEQDYQKRMDGVQCTFYQHIVGSRADKKNKGHCVMTLRDLQGQHFQANTTQYDLAHAERRDQITLHDLIESQQNETNNHINKTRGVVNSTSLYTLMRNQQKSWNLWSNPLAKERSDKLLGCVRCLQAVHGLPA